MVSAPSMPAEPPDRPEPAPRGHDRDAQLGADPHELGDLLRWSSAGRRRAAARPVGRPSRRSGSSRDRSRRSAGGRPAARARIASTRGSAPACGSVGAVTSVSLAAEGGPVAGRYDGLDGSRAARSLPPPRWPLPSPDSPRLPVRRRSTRHPSGVASTRSAMAAIAPGSVNRSSLDAGRHLRRNPQADLGDAGRSGSTRRRRSATPRAGRSTASSSTRSPRGSGTSGCDRSPSTARRSRRRSATRRSSCRSAGILRAGRDRRGSGSATARACGPGWPDRTGCSRGPTASPTSTAGCRG